MSENAERMLLQMEANRLIAELSFHLSLWNTAPAAPELAAQINAIGLRLAALRKPGIVPPQPHRKEETV